MFQKPALKCNSGLVQHHNFEEGLLVYYLCSHQISTIMSECLFLLAWVLHASQSSWNPSSNLSEQNLRSHDFLQAYFKRLACFLMKWMGCSFLSWSFLLNWMFLIDISLHHTAHIRQVITSYRCFITVLIFCCGAYITNWWVSNKRQYLLCWSSESPPWLLEHILDWYTRPNR